MSTSASETLRDHQKRIARERILDAAAEAILANGLSDLSVPAVAEAAGVSLRTVYNYFETKDALIDGIGALAEERLDQAGAIDVVEDLDDLGEAIKTNWPLFASLGTLGDAWSIVRVTRALARGTSAVPNLNTGLDAAIRRALAAELTPPLDEDQVEAVFLLLRGILSSDAFYRMRQSGVGPDESAATTAWALRVLLTALRNDDRPF